MVVLLLSLSFCRGPPPPPAFGGNHLSLFTPFFSGPQKKRSSLRGVTERFFPPAHTSVLLPPSPKWNMRMLPTLPNLPTSMTKSPFPSPFPSTSKPFFPKSARQHSFFPASPVCGSQSLFPSPPIPPPPSRASPLLGSALEDGSEWEDPCFLRHLKSSCSLACSLLSRITHRLSPF